MMVQLGWKAGPEQFAPNELLEYAEVADDLGFDTLDVSDHFQPWSQEGQASFTWTWLGAAAMRTKRIQLGTGVTCPILRYHPAVIAQAAATLAVLAPGRTYLGVGTGEALNDYAAAGEWPGYAERRARLAEAINLIRSLWTGEAVTFNGFYYRTRRAKLYTRPTEAISLYVSSMVPQSADFAGEYGDGLITVGGEKPEVYRQIMQNFQTGAKKVGKEPARMPRLIELNVAYTKDKEAAVRSIKKYWAGSLVPALFDQKIYTPAMSERNGAVVGTDTIEERMCISADPEDHVAFAQRYIDLGFTHLYFHSADPDQRGFLEKYARDVLPKIRERQAQLRRAA